MTRVADLRIRLEGRLETVEDGSAALEALLRLADPRRWQEAPALLLSRLDAWQALQPQLDAALKEVRKQPELGAVVRRHETLRGRLSARIAWHHQPLRGTRGLEARLDRWGRVVAPFVLARPAPPLLAGWGRQNEAHLLKSLAAAALVGASPLPTPAGAVAVMLAFLGFVASMWPTRWRLYQDFLELKALGRAPIRIPLASLTKVEHVVATLELEGLHRVTLISDHGLSELASRIDMRPSRNDSFPEPRVTEG